MRPRHTRRTDQSLNGPSTQRSLRLPEAQVKLVQSAIEAGIPEIHTLTDAATDALWLWLYEQKLVHMSNGTKAQRDLAMAMNLHPERDRVEETDAVIPADVVVARPKFSDVDLNALEEDDGGA